MKKLKLQTLTTPQEYYSTGKALKNALQMHNGEMFFNNIKKEGAEVMVVLQEEKILLAITVRVRDGQRYVDHVVGEQNRRPTEEELADLKELLASINVDLEYDPHTTT